MEIKVLGPGCPRCEARKKNVEEALTELSVGVELKKVTVSSSLKSESLSERSDKNKIGGWDL